MYALSLLFLLSNFIDKVMFGIQKESFVIVYGF